jgi:hypothetical protein
MTTLPTYDAFISYRRADGARVARWLRAELQQFRLPPGVDSEHAPLRAYLDTAYQRASSDFYAQTIKPALLNSRFLIVVATPAAANRSAGEDWMWREIADYLAQNGPTRVVLVRAVGELLGALPAGLQERAPNLDVVDLRGASRFSFLNPVRNGRLADELVKILGVLLELPPDQMPLLRREEERRQQRRLGATAGALAAILVAAIGLTTFALTSRWQAKEAVESSLFATGRLLISTVRTLEDLGASADARSTLINDACDLMEKLDRESQETPPALATATCKVERALSWQALGESTRARTMMADAVASAEAMYRAEPSADGAFAVFKTYRRRLQLFDARDQAKHEAEVMKTVERFEQLSDAHPSMPQFAEDGAELLIDLLRSSKTGADEKSFARAERAIKLLKVALAAQEGDTPAAVERLQLKRAGLAAVLAVAKPMERSRWTAESREALKGLGTPRGDEAKAAFERTRTQLDALESGSM